MDNNFMELILMAGVFVTYIVLISIIVILAVILFKEKSIHKMERDLLLNRLVSTDLTELAQTKAAFEALPSDIRKNMQVENDLATKATAIIEDRESKGFYGAPVS